MVLLERQREIDANRTERRLPAAADTDARLRVHLRALERVAGVGEECQRPARTQRLLELETARRERRAADDLAVCVDGAEFLERVAAHAVVAAREEAHRGWKLFELALGRGAGLAADDEALAAGRGPDPFALRDGLRERRVGKNRVERAAHLERQPRADVRPNRVVGANALPADAGHEQPSTVLLIRDRI